MFLYFCVSVFNAFLEARKSSVANIDLFCRTSDARKFDLQLWDHIA